MAPTKQPCTIRLFPVHAAVVLIANQAAVVVALKTAEVPSKDTRREYYLGSWAASAAKLDESILRTLLANRPKLGSSAFTFQYNERNQSCPLCDETGAVREKGAGCNYFRDMQALCGQVGLAAGSRFFVQFGDARIRKDHPRSVPVVVKVRELPERAGALMPLTYNRHFRAIWPETAAQVPWKEKDDRVLVWRGAPTDLPRFRRGGSDQLKSRVWMVQRLAAQGQNVRFVPDILYKRVKNEVDPNGTLAGEAMSRAQIMRSKYVLSLEGNDVSTGLKWALAHGSLVVMPHPTRESWLMEGLLKPYVHYVPLENPDKVHELLDWLRSHDTEVKKIVANANAWMEQFRPRVETGDELVADEYVDHVLKFAMRTWSFLHARLGSPSVQKWPKCNATSASRHPTHRQKQ
uniref:Glycosyl transferase CAP10 domain-containing protein n=1 Tax=Chrysotila carterae TaxID=13221 RepID=A0A7S4F4G2_CHRCT